MATSYFEKDFDSMTRLQMSPELWRAKFGDRPFASDGRGRYVALTGMFACEGATEANMTPSIIPEIDSAHPVDVSPLATMYDITPQPRDETRFMSA